MIELKRAGVNPLSETKAESEIKVSKKKRYNQIIEILEDLKKPMTAKETAIEMKLRGYAKYDERNLTAPRFTELLKLGILNCVGTKIDPHTNRRVGLFELRKEDEL